MKDGNDDRLARSVTVGASDFGVTLDGPAGANTRLILSARRSYLQYLASAIGLPFLPTYNDAQLRWHWHPNDRDQFAVLAIGAIDQFELNTDATDTEFQRWVLDNLPETPQWNYTTGATWKHLAPVGRAHARREPQHARQPRGEVVPQRRELGVEPAARLPLPRGADARARRVDEAFGRLALDLGRGRGPARLHELDLPAHGHARGRAHRGLRFATSC